MAEFLSEDLFGFVRSDPGITALVGQRIYPVVRPQLGNEQRATALTYRLASRRGNLLTGKEKDGRTESLYQFVGWAKEYLTAKQIVKAVYDALESQYRPFGNVGLIALDDEVDDYSPETNEFFITLDLRVIEIRKRH